MIIKSFFSVVAVLVFNILHAGCCLLPLFSIAAGSLTYLEVLTQYKFLFTALQFTIFIYIAVKLIRHYRGNVPFHSRLERLSCQISFVITAAGMLMGYLEPYPTRDQGIAQQQFSFFKSHGELEFGFAEDYNREKLRNDVAGIDGVKAGRIRIGNSSVLLTFRRDQTSGPEIMQALKEKGYSVFSKK